MKYAALGRRFVFSLLIALLPLLICSCQEKNAPGDSAEVAAPAAESTESQEQEKEEMTPADNQGAPVPQGQALEVLRFGPSGPINKLSQLVAMFNQPMVALGDYQNVPNGVISIDPPIEGDYLWLNQYTLAFIPKEPLTGSLDLSARLDPSKLKALSGVTASEAVEIEIQLPDLAVQNAYKMDNIFDEDQALRPAWRVYFNQSPDLDSLKEKIFFVYTQDGDEKRVPAEIDDNKNAVAGSQLRPTPEKSLSFIFKAREKLPRNTPYKIIAESGLKSTAGPKPAAQLEIGSDSTYGPLKIIVENLNDKPLPPNQGLYLSFSNPVDFREILPLLNIDNGYDLKPLRDYYVKPVSAENEADENDGQKDFESVDAIGTYLYIDGRFKAESQYSITVDSAAKDIFGQSLAENFVFNFRTGQYPTNLDLGNSYGLLETATDPRFKLVASNIKEARLEAYALPAEDAIEFLGATNFSPDYYYGDFKNGDKILARSEAREVVVPIPGGAKNGRVRVPVDLKKIFGDDLKGNLLFLKSSWTRSGNRENQGRTFAIVQVSDIGLAVKVGPASSLIWTTNISAGRSWAGVELEIRGPEGELLWQGKSDEDGLASLPGTVELLKKIENRRQDKQNPGIFVVARSGDQMSLWNAKWNDGLETWRWNIDFADSMSGGGDDRHLLLSALPLYKPGEKAKFKIISRSQKSDRFEDYQSKKLYMEVADALGQVQAKAELEVSPFGTSSYELDIPADASLGQWQVRAGENIERLQYAGTFMVQTYRAPAFDVKFENFAKEALVGEEIEIEAKADYHFGAPVAKQPVSYNVVSSPAWFRLPGDFSSYNVTNGYFPADEDEDSGYGYREPTVTVASDQSRLDEDGRFKFPLSLKAAPDQKPSPRDFTVYLTVSDVDERQVSTNNKILVHPADLYVGLDSDNFMGEKGRPFPLKLIVADHQGRLKADRPIKATVYRRTWQNVRRKSAGTAYEYVSRMVDEQISQHQLTSGTMPVGLDIVAEKPGYYIVQAEIKDDRERTNLASYGFYIWGDGPVGWRMSNDEKLTLIPDKNSYAPGETAKIMIQSPFDQGEGLLTVERSGVRLTKTFKIDSQTPIVEVPVREEDSPNVFVSVLLSRGRISDTLNEEGVDFGKPAIRLGYTELKVPTSKNLLAVEVKADKAEIGPGQEVEVEVAVRDSEGRPWSEAEVALIAADAAVLQLAGDDGYFPERVLHRDQPLRIQTADNLVSLIGRQNWGLKGGNPGGGGAMMADMARAKGADGLRRDFASLAYFDPQVSLDSQGRAKVKIKMPENLSTFKIFAVATGHGVLSGTGQSSVLVTRDLLVRSALPGYAGVGDEFTAAMVVSNRGQKSGEATVSLKGENFTLLDGEADRTVSVGPGESREVGFKVKAGSADSAKFQFSVTMGQDKDGAEFVIPLSPANQLVTQASYERITGDGGRVDLALPPGADLSRGGVEIELSPSLAGVLSEPFDWLLAYPHGCVEQAVSKAFGSLTWLALKDRYPADPKKEEKARQNVNEMLAKLVRWEQGGGFNTWPQLSDWNSRSVYLTAYALDFILSAREAGFKADANLIKNIQGFLKQALDSKYQGWPKWYSEAGIRQSKSYALAMLSRSGENVAAYISVMYKERNTLGLFELVNLTEAINRQTQLEQATKMSQINSLVKLMENHIHVTAGEIQFTDNTQNTPEIWSSPVRNSALVLKVLCEVKPDHDLLPALVRWLAGETRNGHFGTTHNNAQALSALAKYVKIMEPVNPDLSVKALLGSSPLAEARFTAFTDPAVRGSAPLTSIPEDDPAVVYSLEGQGQVWSALKLKSAPAEADLSAATSGGFMLSRAFTVLDAEGKGKPGAQSFKRGDLVRVSVTMMVPARRHSVVLEDRVPAGFEPVNFMLRDADMSLQAMVNESGSGYPGYWYAHMEIWPDKVAVYADYLDSGVYTFSYLARAITPGTYLTPGPVAEEMYAPETFGRGEGQSLTVK